MKLVYLTLALAMGTTGANAQDNTINLREALDLLPELILTNPASEQAELNPISRAAFTAMAQRQFSVLQIGIEP